jgi:predicted transcriptional regulator
MRTKGHPSATINDLFPDSGKTIGTVEPTSIRFSSMLVARVDELAEERGVTRTACIERLLAYALDALGQVEDGATASEELQARRRRTGGKRGKR